MLTNLLTLGTSRYSQKFQTSTKMSWIGQQRAVLIFSPPCSIRSTEKETQLTSGASGDSWLFLTFLIFHTYFQQR